MNYKIIDIKGMHCNSCEMLIEEEVAKIPVVKRCKVNYRKGRAEISYEGNLDPRSVQSAIEEAGYSLGKDEKHFFSHNPKDYLDLVMTVITIFVLYTLGKALGIFDLGSNISNNYGSLPIVFLVGLTAGVSTCMALVGGLVLGASARFAEKHPYATPIQKFKPHLFFNLGRIISYFILGGAIGYLGSFLKLSNSFLGILTIAAGMIMLLIGIQLTQVIPGLNKFKFALPSGLGKKFNLQSKSRAEYSHKNSAVMGALTFFLPCGFTQAMQLYSISTGNPAIGALTMGVFALGTAPGLLGIGGLTSVVKGVFAKQFFKFAGIVVIALAFFNISTGLTLADIQFKSIGSVEQASAVKEDIQGANVQNGVQVLEATYSPNEDMKPSSFTVKAGQPVRLEVAALEDGVGCMGSLMVIGSNSSPQLFTKGQKAIVEFTPEAKNYTIACAMGVPRGVIKAI